jgi:Tol biopolymer transport system component
MYPTGTLYTVAPDGSDLSRLTTDDRYWWAADWSPDGRFIVSMEATPPATGNPGDWVDNGVYVMSADGSDPRLLEGLWGRPSWGPAPSRQTVSPSPTATEHGGPF